MAQPYSQYNPAMPGGGNSTTDPSNLSSGGGSFGDMLFGQNSFRASPVVYDTANSFQARDAGQAAAAGMGKSADFYQGLMTGTQPSLAQRQMQQGISQGQATAMQQAGGARGMDRAAAFRQAQNNSANAAAQGAIAGGNLRLQEQQLGASGNLQSQQGIGALQQATRQADIGEQLGIIGQDTQRQGINAGVTSQNAQNAQRGMGGMLQMAGGLLASDIRNKEGVAPAGTFANALTAAGATEQGQQPMMQQPAPVNYAAPQQMQPAGGGADYGAALSGLGSALSDENSKESLKGVHPYQFEYKDQFAHSMGMKAAQDAYARAFADAKTPRVGVMAQDLAANPEAREAVVKTPDGLAIEGKRAMGLMLANQADFNDRLRALEGVEGRAA